MPQRVVEMIGDPAMITVVKHGLFIVQAWNHHLEQLLGRGGEHAIGQPANLVVPPWNPARRRRNERRLVRDGTLTTTIAVRHRDRPLLLDAVGVQIVGKGFLTILRKHPQIPDASSRDLRHVPNLGTYANGNGVGQCPAMSTATDDLDQTVGANLRVARLEHKPRITQAQLATELGMSRTNMNDVEHGRRSINRVRLLRAAELLGVSVDWLCTDHSGGPR